jgi:invasion protein IalB
VTIKTFLFLLLVLGGEVLPAASQSVNHLDGPASASQPTSGEGNYTQRWYKICLQTSENEEQTGTMRGADESLSRRECFTAGDIIYPADLTAFGKIALSDISNNGNITIFILLGLPANNPITLVIKNDNLISLKPIGCDQSGCYSAANVDGNILNDIKSNSKIECLLLNGDGSSLILYIDLNGFGDIYSKKNDPENPYKKDEQHTLVKILGNVLKIYKNHTK